MDYAVLIKVGGSMKTISYLILKRIIDIIGSIIGIVLVSPVLLVTAVLIKLESKGRIIFFSNQGWFTWKGILKFINLGQW